MSKLPSLASYKDSIRVERITRGISKTDVHYTAPQSDNRLLSKTLDEGDDERTQKQLDATTMNERIDCTRSQTERVYVGLST